MIPSPSAPSPPPVRGHDDFIRLYARAYPAIYAFVLSLLPGSPEAEDLVQQTSLVLWRKFDRFVPGSFSSWAFQIARYEVLNHLRARSRDRHVFSADLVDLLAEEHPANAEELEAERRALDSCLGKLPEPDRVLLRRCYSEGTTLIEERGEFAPALFPIDEELRLPDRDYTVAFWFRTGAKDVRLCEARRYSSYNNRWSDHIVRLDSGRLSARFRKYGDAPRARMRPAREAREGGDVRGNIVDRVQRSGRGCSRARMPAYLRIRALRFILQGDGPLETADTCHDGRWHHVATTVGEGGQRLHVDGKLVASGKLSRRIRTSNRLGLDLGPGPGEAAVAIDELKVFGRALAPADVERLAGRP